MRIELHVPAVLSGARARSARKIRNMAAALRAHLAQAAHAELGQMRRAPPRWYAQASMRRRETGPGSASSVSASMPVIASVAAGADDDGATQAELVLQGEIGLGQCFTRDVGTVGCERIPLRSARRDGCGCRMRRAGRSWSLGIGSGPWVDRHAASPGQSLAVAIGSRHAA